MTSEVRRLTGVRRVVVKVGSAVIASGGHLQPERITALAADVRALRERGCEVIMVVSGAVACGYRALGFAKSPAAVVERQAAASIGQHRLMAVLDDVFSAHGIAVAQLLMSAEDVENRRRFLSAKHTFQMLISRGAVPIVNENDALSDDEIKVGDNDHLAALVTSVVSADLLIILSRVSGLYANGCGSVISDVHFGSDVEQHIQATLSETGVGGMGAKVSAARLAARWNTPTVIADGTTPGTLPRILAGEPVGTLFHPHGSTLNARKRWIAMRSRSRGAIRVDAGAQRAILEREASLLPSGVRAVIGDFAIGARVDVQTEAGETIAVGLTCYSANDIRRVAGRRAADIAAILGYVYTDEIIHRDDLVVVATAGAAAAPTA